jgi:glycosyltransferase involved in cell wall biosynthesis
MRAPVSACLIVRNESARIRQCLQSIRPYVEEICVVDTGSTDGTWDLLRADFQRSGLVDKVSQFLDCNEEPSIHSPIADFSKAREESFKLATQPWVVWVDGDDVLINAQNLENVCKQYEHLENVLVMFPYEYSHDHHGNCTCRHYRERLIKGAKNGKWLGPVHEVWVPDPGFHIVPACDEVVWYHKREGKVDSVSNRNLRILEKWLKDNDGPNVDARMLYYTALEYGQTGNLAKSIEFHMRYVEKSGWDDEKCLSMLDLARHHQTLGNYERAVEWATKAMLVKENWREPRFSLSRSYYYLAQKGGPNAWTDWQRCVNHAVQGLSLPPSVTPLFINPLETAVDIHRYLNVGLERLGRIHEARVSVETALKAAPDDPNLIHNKRWYTEIIAKWDLDKALSELVQIGTVTQDQLAAIKGVLEGRFARVATKSEALDIASDEKSISHEPPSVASPATSGTSKNPNPLDIVLFTGQAWESWNPEFLDETGMGGSETMAWEMSRRLVRLGHRVRVYADCGDNREKEGTFEGVEWIHWQKFLDPPTAKGPTCDVMISSRIPDLVDYDFKAKLKLGWVHDVSMGQGLTNKRALKFDRFLCLSNWHRSFFLSQYPFLHPDSVIVTRNGIDPNRYITSEVTRNPHRMIYSSSPDRGLQTVVKCMPLIRNFVPDATLHVYYGFENWEKHPDPGQKQLATAIKGILSTYEPFGVVCHGRVPGKQLAIEQLKSGVWAYSTWFSETSCITAMEAQAAGCRIVTSPIAALNETVGNRGKMIPGDWLSPEYTKAFAEACVEALTQEGNADRVALQQYARENFSLDSLAKDWEKMFHQLIAEVKDQPLQKYQPVAA